jgi:hypothetical protein
MTQTVAAPNGNVGSAIDALRRWGGMYGSAYRDNFLLQEAIEVSGNVAIARIEVPLVGATRMGYKAGRETREGTMRIQAIDSTWALQVFQFTGQSLQDRINARGTAGASLPSFDLVIAINDPTAYDFEEWQFKGVQVWQMPVGFAITDDIVQREIPITWEEEIPTHVFVIDRSSGTPVSIPVVNGDISGLVPFGRY